MSHRNRACRTYIFYLFLCFFGFSNSVFSQNEVCFTPYDFLKEIAKNAEIPTNPTPKTKPVERHFSAQMMGLTYHPGGGSFPKSYPLRLDDAARWVLTPGIAIGYDWSAAHYKWIPKWLAERTFFRASGSYYRDCAYFHAGYVHLGARVELLRWGRHRFNFGMGPVFLFRGDWHKIEGYRGGDFFDNRVYKDWQYRLFPFGGEAEYLLRLNKNISLQYSIVPGYPTLIVSRLGLRWRIGEKN
ncbi:MAG: hypothetical protein RL757_1769 [Bacteroidota bacterium]|jgi:hypothetical protein